MGAEMRTGGWSWRARSAAADLLLRLSALIRPKVLRSDDLAGIAALVEHLPIAVWAKNRDGLYLLANRAHHRFFDLPADLNITGRHHGEFFDPDDVARFQQKDREVIDSGRTEQFYEPVHFPNRVMHVITLKFPLSDQSGRRIAACGLCVDVSDLILLRERLERANLELQARERQLLAISRSPDVDSGELRAAMQLVTAAAREGLAVERVGVWLFGDDRESLECRWSEDLLGPAPEPWPGRLERSQFPRYFTALDEQRQIVAEDAGRNP